MKRIKVILFVFSLLMFMPNVVSAECDYNEKNKLQSLATNLNFTYNYKEIENNGNYSVKFSITVANLQPELYVVDQTNMKIYYYNDNKEVTISNYNAGSTTQFIVYANVGECRGQQLITNYITLPSYNRYYKDPICEDVTDYKLCNRWSLVNLSYDDFVKKVKEYKEQVSEEIPIVNKEPDLIEKIIDFLSKYSIYLFGGIALVCSGLIFYLKRKDDFDLS